MALVFGVGYPFYPVAQDSLDAALIPQHITLHLKKRSVLNWCKTTIKIL
jgi:hypothetical protein